MGKRTQVQRRNRWLVMDCAVYFAFAALLVACGGGSGSDGGSGGQAPVPVARATSSQLQPDANLIPSADVRQLIVASAPASDGLTHLTVPATAATVASEKWGAGKVVTLPGGVGTPFPLGLSGRVTSRSQRSDGGLDVVLSPVLLVEAVQSYIQEARSVPLDASNFIGVISPSSVRGLQAIQHGKGLLISNAPTTTLKTILSQRSAVAPTELGTIELSASIDLAELKGPENQQGPISAESKVTVSGSFSKLKLVQQMDLDKRSSIPVGLKSMDLRVVGDLSVEAKLEGNFDVTVGSYSNAWKSVEERSLSLLGLSAKLSGLEAKDKIGKYPITGLVFSVPCAATVTCPVATGVTDIPLIEAQTGGVIIWVYLTSSGRLTVEGSVGVKLHQGSLEVGMVKPSSGGLDIVAKLTGSGTDTLIEAPRISGTASLQAKAGAEIEVDLFVGGVWIGNAGVFGGMQYNGKVTTVGALAYGAPQLAGPWQWTGSACVSSTFGTGLQAHGAFAIGASVETSWKDISAALKYEFSLPEASDLTKAGSYTLGGVPIWVVYSGLSKCWPEPAVATVSPSEVTIGDSNRFVVTGSNLPPTLQAKFDDGASTCAAPEQITSTGFTVVCVAGGKPGPRTLNVSVADVPITNSRNVTFNARPVSPPALFFTSSASVITQGASAVLDWSTLDASSCTASGAWTGTVATAGRQTVSPAIPGEYSYSLSCNGPGGLSTGRVNLQVNAATVTPPVVSFSASPTQVVQGSASVLSWSSTDATSCSARGSWSGAMATAGSQAVTPTVIGPNGYELSCSGIGGTTTASTIVTVTSGSSTPTVTLTATPSGIAAGQSANLSWSATNASGCTASGAWSGTRPTSGSSTVTPVAGSHVYTLTCSGQGGSGQASTSVTVSTCQAGQVLQNGACVPATTGFMTGTGITALQCYSAGSSTLGACTAAGPLSLSGIGKQDGMRFQALTYALVTQPITGTYAATECVRDQVTGLVWEGKRNDGSARSAANSYTNFGDGRVGDASAYVTYVNGLGLCGYTDWRLPTIKELHTLIDYARQRPFADLVSVADPTWFPALDGYFTSADFYASASGWRVDFLTGNSGGSAMSGGDHVMLVRGAMLFEGSARYSYSSDGSEVTDASTGLTWKRCVEGASWTGSTCAGTAVSMTHEQALQRANAQPGWRVPDVKELRTLVERARTSTDINTVAFPASTQGEYWSSTPSVGAPTSAWVVSFRYGYVATLDRAQVSRLRLVKMN